MCECVFEYGRTRARKSVFRICQNRAEFTNTLASCLRFSNFAPVENCSFLAPQFSLATTGGGKGSPASLFRIFSVPFCPFAAPFTLYTMMCWGILSLTVTVGPHTNRSSSLSLSLTSCALLQNRVFHTRLLRPRRKLFHCCYFFFLPNRDSWPFFLRRRNRQINEIFNFFFARNFLTLHGLIFFRSYKLNHQIELVTFLFAQQYS